MAGNEAGLEKVYQKHKSSKGPYYAALSEATEHVSLAFDYLRHDVDAMRTKKEVFESDIRSLRSSVSKLQKQSRDCYRSIHKLKRTWTEVKASWTN